MKKCIIIYFQTCLQNERKTKFHKNAASNLRIAKKWPTWSVNLFIQKFKVT